MSAVLAEHPNAHVLLLDPHNEYGKAFGEIAEVVNVDNLQLPLWLLDFEESVEVLIRGGTEQEQEAQAIILKDAITRARRRFVPEDIIASSITVDSPVPFKASDLLRFIDEAMGKLDNPDSSAPYLRLRTRLESLRHDRRFAFMFSDWLVTRDTLAQIVGRLLAHSGRRQTADDYRSVGHTVRDRRCRGINAMPLDLRFRAVGRAGTHAAGSAGMRGSAPLCPGFP